MCSSDLAECPANFENPSPSLVLGLSKDSPRTKLGLGLSKLAGHSAKKKSEFSPSLVRI